MRITALSRATYVVGVETPTGKYKLFQIIRRKDGSLLVPFPYYSNESAQLIEGKLKANETYPNGLTVCGPVATSRVKYTHHLDGEAHFSQDGKILTRVRKRANPLPDCAGHLFTVQLQGLHDFAYLSERDLKKHERAYVCLRYKRELSSLKIVAHLYTLAQFRSRMSITSSNSSPWFRLCVENRTIPAVLLSVGQPGAVRLLSLSFEEIPTVSPGKQSIFTFMGGFDPPTITLDNSKESSFLMLISPAGDDTSEAIRKLGTVDYKTDHGNR
jgi:hypothetical protein